MRRGRNSPGHQKPSTLSWSTNLFQEPTVKQLQQQSDQLAKLQQLGEEQKKQLEAKLQQLWVVEAWLLYFGAKILSYYWKCKLLLFIGWVECQLGIHLSTNLNLSSCMCSLTYVCCLTCALRPYLNRYQGVQCVMLMSVCDTCFANIQWLGKTIEV